VVVFWLGSCSPPTCCKLQRLLASFSHFFSFLECCGCLLYRIVKAYILTIMNVLKLLWVQQLVTTVNIPPATCNYQLVSLRATVVHVAAAAVNVSRFGTIQCDGRTCRGILYCTHRAQGAATASNLCICCAVYLQVQDRWQRIVNLVMRHGQSQGGISAGIKCTKLSFLRFFAD
jgi:hypothetical protein